MLQDTDARMENVLNNYILQRKLFANLCNIKEKGYLVTITRETKMYRMCVDLTKKQENLLITQITIQLAQINNVIIVLLLKVYAAKLQEFAMRIRNA